MIRYSNSIYLRIFTNILVLLLVSKFLSLLVWWFLPNEGIDIVHKENYQPKYQRVDFKNMIYSSKSFQKNITTGPSSSEGISIKNMLLKGLYGKSNNGYVIVSLKISPKLTSIVGIGESFSGYSLKSIELTRAIFTKDGLEYILELQERNKSNSFIVKVSGNREISTVSKNDISFYANNPSQIWKDIAITEVKKGKDINGFKVTRVNKRSKMAILGLKKGDIIIKANNIELKSYKDALSIYNNIDKLKTIQLIVIRNNQEKELVYEIN